MDVSVRELRNHTARVIAAIESGEPVVLTVHGRPVADIVPHQRRSDRRAASEPLREVREATLGRARRFIALPYDERVAERLADLLATARDRQCRAGAMDAIIAATALAHDLAVWAQDDDFDVLADLAPALRVERA